MRPSVALLLTFATSISAHAVMLGAVGDAGDGKSIGFGVKDDVSRTETGRTAQVDTSIIRTRDETSGRAGPCGRTNAGGPIKLKEEMEKASSGNAIAQVRTGGEITMTAHVGTRASPNYSSLISVNGDGRGPFTCQASADDGASWTDMEVTTNVPRNRATDFPLKARFPASMTGNAQGLATVRCMNAARAGPFGGCLAARIVA